MGEPNTPAVTERKERDKRGSMVVEKVKGRRELKAKQVF
jgi:hypothetical protein